MQDIQNMFINTISQMLKKKSPKGYNIYLLNQVYNKFHKSI